MNKTDTFFKNRIEDLKNMAFQRDIVMFTEFLDLHQLHMIHNLGKDFSGIAMETSGGYECAERQIRELWRIRNGGASDGSLYP